MGDYTSKPIDMTQRQSNSDLQDFFNSSGKLLENVTVKIAMQEAKRALYLLAKQIFDNNRVQQRFRPPRILIQRMNIGQYILEETQQREANALIDFCILIMENSKGDLELTDFSESDRILWRLRRREFERKSQELEQTNGQIGQIVKNFTEYKQTTQGAFGEFINLITAVKTDLGQQI